MISDVGKINLTTLSRKNMFFPLLSLPLLFGQIDLSMDHATVSAYAIDMNTKEVLINMQSDLSLIPASCLKIATTGAALHLLGPEETFQTHLEYDGNIDEEKTLHGNLYIRGGGDPCLGSNRISSSLAWEKQLETWASAIESLGIKRILGKIIGDASCWEKALVPASWEWEDLGNYYGAGACALSFHENLYSVYFKPANKVNKPASILRIEPLIPSLLLKNEVKTGPIGSGDQAYIYGCEFSMLQYVRGTIPKGVLEFSIKGAIPDPPNFCADALDSVLCQRGILIQNQSLPLKGNRTLFHTTKSPTIEKIVHWTNQKSINLYAEHLLKKIGSVICNEGSTSAGVRAVTEFWKMQEIDLEGFHMVDGSGHSRQNLTTTKQLVSMLLIMKSSKYFPIFLRSLPKNTAHVLAKSGNMKLIKGLVGYKDDIAFAILINQCPDRKKMQDKINFFLSNL